MEEALYAAVVLPDLFLSDLLENLGLVRLVGEGSMFGGQFLVLVVASLGNSL